MCGAPASLHNTGDRRAFSLQRHSFPLLLIKQTFCYIRYCKQIQAELITTFSFMLIGGFLTFSCEAVDRNIPGS